MSRLHSWMYPISNMDHGCTISRNVCQFSNNLFQTHSIDERAFPIQLLPKKKSFCNVFDTQECIRCQSNKARKSGGDSGASSVTSSHDFSSLDLSNNNDKTFSIDGRAFPIQLLPEKKSFCSMFEEQECIRCENNKIRKSGGDSVTSLISKHDFDYFNLINDKNKKEKTCSFCYVHYKKHCQKLDRPWPRMEDRGFWQGHSIKDDFGNVVCPELHKLMCPLCFATGNEAHTLKFCPLNTFSNKDSML